MNILRLLLDKQASILNDVPVHFDKNEIEILSDKNQLRALKIIGKDFQFTKSLNIMECISHIKENPSLDKTLEYCVLRNPILAGPVKSIFKEFR